MNRDRKIPFHDIQLFLINGTMIEHKNVLIRNINNVVTIFGNNGVTQVHNDKVLYMITKRSA